MSKKMTPTQNAKLREMVEADRPTAEIIKAIGCSATTVSNQRCGMRTAEARRVRSKTLIELGKEIDLRLQLPAIAAPVQETASRDQRRLEVLTLALRARDPRSFLHGVLLTTRDPEEAEWVRTQLGAQPAE